MKVIICDDDPNQRDSIRLCFEVSGRRNELIEFELGADAVDYLAAYEADLIFLDMGLPDMDGLDVLEHIPNDSEAVRWCFDHLEQGGWLTITVPAFPFLWSDHDVHVSHHRRYNKSNLQGLIEKHFVVRKLSYFNFLLFAPIAIVRLCRRKSPSFSDTEIGAHGGGLAASLYNIFNLERRLINLINFPFGVSLIGVFQRIGNPDA